MEITEYKSNLPDTVEKLHEFILVGKEQQKAHMARIGALEKIDAAQSVKDAALAKGQNWAEIIIDAEAKLGKVLEAIEPKYDSLGSYGGTKGPPPRIKTLPSGLTKKESHFAQALARNLDIIDEIKLKARQNRRLATSQEVYRKIAQNRQMERQAEFIKTELIKGIYRTIVIDPPWPMEKILRDVAPYQAEFEYKYMSIMEIRNIKIPAGDHAHLYLWTTQKFLPMAFEILEQWGFKYIFTMVWHKAGGFQPFNLPQYNCEFVLFGRRGNLNFTEIKNFFTCFHGQRREHSRKPQEFYELVERISPAPRINIFSREEIDGFESYGNEKGKFNNGN